MNNLEAALAETPDVEGVTFLSEQTMEVREKRRYPPRSPPYASRRSWSPLSAFGSGPQAIPSLTDDGVIITEKLSRLIGRGADSLTLKDGSGAQVERKSWG